MNNIRKFKIEIGELNLKGTVGRKSKENIVKEWQQQHPNGTKYRCSKDTGLSENTVRKWWLNG